MYVLAMYFKLVQENAYVWMVTKYKRDVSYRQNLTSGFIKIHGIQLWFCVLLRGSKSIQEKITLPSTVGPFSTSMQNSIVLRCWGYN